MANSRVTSMSSKRAPTWLATLEASSQRAVYQLWPALWLLATSLEQQSWFTVTQRFGFCFQIKTSSNSLQIRLPSRTQQWHSWSCSITTKPKRWNSSSDRTMSGGEKHNDIDDIMLIIFLIYLVHLQPPQKSEYWPFKHKIHKGFRLHNRKEQSHSYPSIIIYFLNKFYY